MQTSQTMPAINSVLPKRLVEPKKSPSPYMNQDRERVVSEMEKVDAVEVGARWLLCGETSEVADGSPGSS